jgi:hypothetical protein
MGCSSLEGSETNGWGTRVDAGKMIVVVGYRDDLVLAAVAVVVTDEASLEMLFDRYLRSGC